MKLANKGSDELNYLTRHGEARLSLRRYSGPDGPYRPGEEALDDLKRRISLNLIHLLVRICLFSCSFRGAVKELDAFSLPRVSHETLRGLVQNEGREAQKALDEQALSSSWWAQDCQADESQPSRVVMGVDGFTIRTVTEAEKVKRRRQVAGKRGAKAKRGKKPRRKLPKRKSGSDQKFKEVKVVGVYDVGHEHSHWRATHQNHQGACVLMGQVADRVGFAKADQKVAISDGAPWIAGRLGECGVAFDAHILDFYHLAEHVHKTAKAVEPKDDSAAKALADQWLELVRFGGAGPLLTHLNAKLEEGLSDSAAQAVRGLIGYVEPRSEMVDYPRFEAAGWPIGSGPTESMAKALPKFVKGRGKRWDAESAVAMMSLEALKIDEDLEDFFTYRLNPQPPLAKAA